MTPREQGHPLSPFSKDKPTIYLFGIERDTEGQLIIPRMNELFDLAEQGEGIEYHWNGESWRAL